MLLTNFRIKTIVFLPGLDRRTIDIGAALARSHTTFHWIVRRDGKQRKAEQVAEADLASTYEQALRELPRHQRAIAIVGTAPPIMLRYPPCTWVEPQNRSRAANKGTPYVIDFQTAEARHKSFGAEKPPAPEGI